MTETAPTEPDSLRLFFALWPDEVTRTALNHTGKWLHQHWGGRRMRADTLHLTLAFLGSTPAEQLDALVTRVNAVQAQAFDLTLDLPGYCLHKQVGWFEPSQPPTQLGELVAKMDSAIMLAGVKFDARPHMPHVTLLRNTAGGDLPGCQPVFWTVRNFVLVKSISVTDCGYYEVIRRWSLHQ